MYRNVAAEKSEDQNFPGLHDFPIIEPDRRLLNESVEMACDPDGASHGLIIAKSDVNRSHHLFVFDDKSGENCFVVRADSEFRNCAGIKPVRLQKCDQAFRLRSAGDIGCVAKLAVTTTGDTLGSKEHPVKLEPIDFPESVFCMAVNPKTKADLDKMSSALPRICEEDLTLKTQREADTGELLLCGMGETHLDVASEKIIRKFGAEIILELPKVPYKETITSTVQAEYKHKKQTGGHGQYGHVFLEMEPLPRGTGFEFTEKIVGGAIPRNYIPAVEKGVNEARMEGVLAKYPVIDVKVTLYDGSFHAVDSSEMSFKIAALQAFKKGMTNGHSVLLEPVLNMTITVPDSFTGDIIADLNSKGARVLGMIPEGATNTIQAQAPASAIQRYSIDLRSVTQGRGTFKTEFSHYQEVPSQIAQKIISQRQQEQQ